MLYSFTEKGGFILEDGKAKASTRAKNNYNAKNYDSLRIVVKKGRKAEIKAHAERQGKSINGYVTEAIDEKMERDQE